MEKTDLRVIRTKKAIRQALAELMSMKPLEAITVSDVAAQALINRKTFYAHYSGMHEIISEMEDEIVAALMQLVEDRKFEDILSNPYDLFHDVMQIMNRDIDVYGRLLTVSGNSNLVQKIIQMIRRKLCSTFADEARVDQRTLDMTVYFLLSGLLAVFTEWYHSGRQQSMEELSKQLSCLCFDGVHGIMSAAN